MTNEELAAIAAQGERESLYKLYFAVAPLLYKLISRFFPLCREKAYIEPEDLLQCGYFAFLEAVRSFAPEKGFVFFLTPVPAPGLYSFKQKPRISLICTPNETIIHSGVKLSWN